MVPTNFLKYSTYGSCSRKQAMTHLPLSFRGTVLCIDYTNPDSVLNPSSNYRQQSYFADEGDTVSLLCIFRFDSLLADVKVAPQNTSGRATSVCPVDGEKPGLACKELQRKCVLAFFK